MLSNSTIYYRFCIYSNNIEYCIDCFIFLDTISDTILNGNVSELEDLSSDEDIDESEDVASNDNDSNDHRMKK